MASGSASPGDVWVVEGKNAKFWAAGTGVSDSGQAPPREIWFPALDSVNGAPRRIPAWIHMPPRRPLPVPVLIQIHGGPELQARPAFDPFLRFCVRELGLAVIRPNVRGSTGYGRSYHQLDDGLGRSGAVDDLGALLEWVTMHPELDSSRVAVQGRSYGGFLALAAMTRYGNRLKAGISGVGITHLPAFLEGTAGYRRDLRRAEYGDERIPALRAFLDSLSPLTRADRIRTPLLLTHGRNDPRVPLQQAEALFAALAKSPAETWLFVLEGEGHGLRRKSRELPYHAVAAQFLARHLNLD
jgi:dipeptidyl aminopeptidase/acylaminoacyl peptidase